jgi:hypothetical protein
MSSSQTPDERRLYRSGMSWHAEGLEGPLDLVFFGTTRATDINRRQMQFDWPEQLGFENPMLW